MRIPRHSYVLVADGAKMLFFRNEGDADQLDLRIVEAEQQRDDYDRNLKTDQAGQMPGNPGMGGASTAGEADYHRQAELRFAAEAAERINKATLTGECQRLIVVAPPRTLGDLRGHYHKEVESHLAAEIPKDLTGHSVDKIEKILIKI
jgi:protein required for attachment to host cells